MESEHIQIEGTVASLIYQNPENGYAVIRLDTADGSATAVGCMPGVAPGEVLELDGTWITHPSYGQQFKADSAFRKMPETADAVFRYLSSGAVKGIGPAKAKDIVGLFGVNALDVLENDPQQLSQIRGITIKKALEMGASFRRQVGLRRLMEFLLQYDIHPSVAMCVYRDYGDEAISAVREDPYIIANNEYGAEFFQADAMALSLGFEADCPARVEAAVMFELSHNLNNGHVFLPFDKLSAATDQLLSVGTEAISDAIDSLCDGGFLVRETIAGCDACYLAQMHEAEEYTALRLRQLAAWQPKNGGDVSKIIDSIEKTQGITYAKEQRQAVAFSARYGAMVLTGGPGTGKTTSLMGILSVFDALGLNTVLCAPTGRAAKRMSDITGRSAFTIHRLLGISMGDGRHPVFEHDSENPLDADAVVVDEASMVDITLMASLLRALREDTRLLLVGDCDQLPSVGPGNVFGDIIRSGAVQTVFLREIFRQAGESRIICGAHSINSGEIPDISKNAGDFFFLKRSSPERTAETIVDLCAHRLPEKMNIDAGQIQVLSPMRKNGAGTVILNKLLQDAVNPADDGKNEKIFGDFVFREGDRVMQIRNNYDIIWKGLDGLSSGSGVFNGDVGKIVSINISREELTVDYEDKLATYSFDCLNELEPAYAMTVHKAQGSEYRAVVLSLSGTSPRLMVRSVLYTAVTRARELLIIVGDADVFGAMIANDRRLRRYSGLRARLSD